MEPFIHISTAQFLEKYGHYLPDIKNEREYEALLGPIDSLDELSSTYEWLISMNCEKYPQPEPQILFEILRYYFNDTAETLPYMDDVKLHYHMWTPVLCGYEMPPELNSQFKWVQILQNTTSKTKFKNLYQYIVNWFFGKPCSADIIVKLTVLLMVCIALEHPDIAQTILSIGSFERDEDDGDNINNLYEYKVDKQMWVMKLDKIANDVFT